MLRSREGMPERACKGSLARVKYFTAWRLSKSAAAWTGRRWAKGWEEETRKCRQIAAASAQTLSTGVTSCPKIYSLSSAQGVQLTRAIVKQTIRIKSTMRLTVLRSWVSCKRGSSLRHDVATPRRGVKTTFWSCLSRDSRSYILIPSILGRYLKFRRTRVRPGSEFLI